MQWDSSAHAGFSNVRPWLPVSDDYAHVNVDVQRGDPRSMLTLYRRLIELRRDSSALSAGEYRQLFVDDDLLIYDRFDADQRVVVALNLSNTERELPTDVTNGLIVVLSTYLDDASTPHVLRADEGCVFMHA